MKITNKDYSGHRSAGARRRGIVCAALLGALLLASIPVAMAQVYGVRRTAVVSGPNRTVVASKTTVVESFTFIPFWIRDQFASLVL